MGLFLWSLVNPETMYQSRRGLPTSDLLDWLRSS
jgi:hypothetical protein